MPFDLKQAASNMIDAGASDDEIKGVLGTVRSYAGQLMDQGKSDDEISGLIGKTKWKNTEIFKAAAPAGPPTAPEQPGLMQNIGSEFKQGLRTTLRPGEANFPGAEALRKQGTLGEFMANTVGSALGASQAAFAIPSGIAKTYVGQPLEQAGYPKTAKAAEIGTGLGLSLLGGPIRAAGAAAKYGPGLIKATGAALDPLSAIGSVGKAGREAIASREAGITGAKANLATETGKLEQSQGALAQAMQAKAGLETQAQSLRPPTLPATPERFAQTLIKTPEQVGAGAERAAETFKQVKTTATENLFRESSANYDKLLSKYGEIPVSLQDTKNISNTISDLGDALRGTTATRAVQGKAGAVGDILEGVQGYGPDAVKQIEQQLATQQGLKVADLMDMRNRLSAANRSTSDISAIQANKQVIGTIDDALGHLPQQAGKDFQQARVFHQYVHETVGPESITSQIFHQSPENVVKNIFLPEGKTAPNIEAIRKTKEMFQRVLPEGWDTMSKQALAEFGSRIKDAKTGTLDVQRFGREFTKLEGAFREALPPSQFQAMKDLHGMVNQFNQESSVFRDAQRGLAQQTKQAAQTVTEAKQAVTAQNRAVKGTQAELGSFERQSQYAGAKQVMSPYSMLALAQVGQALQASFTGNWVGVGRQLSQGVVWYTLGNPDFLGKMINSPKLAASLNVIASGQSKGPKLINAGRAVYEAMNAEGQ